MKNPFRKKESRRNRGMEIIAIAEGTRVNGSIDTEHIASIYGHVEGDVTTNSRMIIGTSGYVEGNVTANELEVYGTVNGVIKARSIILAPCSENEIWIVKAERTEKPQ